MLPKLINQLSRFSSLVLILISISLVNGVSAQIPGLQGPFVPIGVEQVTPTSSGADVQMSFGARRTDGATVHAQGTISMTEAQLIDRAFDKMDDPNGQGLKDELIDNGFEPNGEGGFSKPTDNPEDYDLTGTCAGQSMSLSDCVSWVKGQLINEQEYSRILCDPQGSQNVWIRYKTTPESNESTYVVYQTGPGFDMCQDAPGDELPDPQEEEPEPGEFKDFMGGGDPPDIPQAPNPNPPGSPPPLANPDFYRESSSQFFDMSPQFPSTPTMLQLSQQMTNDYDTFSSTTTTANPLPTGMSFSPPPSGTPSGYGSGSGGSDSQGLSGAGAGSGEGDIEVNVDVENICETNPDSLACINTNVGDEVVPTLTVDSVDAGATFSPITLSTASGCPAPVSLPFNGSTIDIEYDMLCNVGPQASPLILLLASLSAGMIILGLRSGT